MQHRILANGLLSLVALFCFVAETEGRTVREAVDALLATRYCGTAAFDGMGLATAIRGETPIAGGDGFDVPEEEWLPVLLEMTAEELEACKRDTADDISGIRQREAAGAKRDANNTSDNEDAKYLWAAYERVQARASKLATMVNCLQFTDGGTDGVLNMLERVGVECPGECDVSHWVIDSIVNKACRCGKYTRCLEFGRRCRDLHGPGCYEEWKLCCNLGNFGLPMLDAESARRECYRYMMEVSETLGSLYFAREFDEMAEKVIPGWVGSVQRRRLAARFPNEPLPRRQSWDYDRQEFVEGEIDELRIPQMLNRRAAAELAANESELTDLREVYGDWSEEKTIPDPIR